MGDRTIVCRDFKLDPGVVYSVTLKPDGRYTAFFYGTHSTGNYLASARKIELFEDGGPMSAELFDTCTGSGSGGYGSIHRPTPPDTFAWDDKDNACIPSSIA
jgi:hypothetical protein